MYFLWWKNAFLNIFQINFRAAKGQRLFFLYRKPTLIQFSVQNAEDTTTHFPVLIDIPMI
jgi:hypothetical protein